MDVQPPIYAIYEETPEEDVYQTNTIYKTLEHARAIQNTNTRLPVMTQKIIEPSYAYGNINGRNSAVDLNGSFLVKKYGTNNSIYASPGPRLYGTTKSKGLNNSISAQ